MPPARRNTQGAAAALLALGRGLLSHPGNDGLRRRLRDSPDPASRFQRQLLCLLVRLFILRASRRAGGVSPRREDYPPGANAPGSPGFRQALEDLTDWHLENGDWQACLEALGTPSASDLGLLYQELLEWHPSLDIERRAFDLVRAAGHRRKTSGSYYTPEDLVECLLRSALDPALDEAASSADPESALLALRVCDPACGSGHFLLAAARRIARRLAEVRSRGEPSDAVPQDALYDVAGRCLYGVDRDSLAVELCRAALWLECGRDDLPLSSLGEHIRCGNSLIGATPALAGEDNPDKWCAALVCPGSQDVDRLRDEYGFFHWHLEFPEVFRPPQAEGEAGWDGGFDVVLGNPPWERIKLQEREWFAVRCPAVAEAPDAATRRRRVAELRRTHPALHAAYLEERRRAEGEARFLRASGRCPLSARGDLNLYGPFVETSRLLLRRGGRVGLVLPSGIATDDTMKDLFQDLLLGGSLLSWYDFHNRRRHFPAVQGNVKFCLLTLAAQKQPGFTAAAQLEAPSQIGEPGRIYTLAAAQVRRLNPNTLLCPAFTSARDAELVLRLHKRFGVLVEERSPMGNPWGLSLGTMFHMTRDAGLFRSREALEADGWRMSGNVFERGGERYLPLYEAKLAQAFHHRAATFDGVAEAVRFRTHARTRPATLQELSDPNFAPLPRYWVPEAEVLSRSKGAAWLLGFRNAISTVADARSLVATVLPRAGVGNSMPLIRGPDARGACLLLALLNSFILDYVLRQKASGGNLNFHVLKQLPAPPPDVFESACPWSPGETLAKWTARRVLELTCTSCDLQEFARECGRDGPLSPWDEERRWRLRCELDAALFRLYGLGREEVEHVLGTFVVARREEVRRHGRFRSREMILVYYDQMGPIDV